MWYHMHASVRQKHICKVFSSKVFTYIFLLTIILHIWAILDKKTCVHHNAIDTMNHYFDECESVGMFWKSLKAWFLRIFQFVITFTVLDVLLGIPNHETTNNITSMIFLILFAKNCTTLLRKMECKWIFTNWRYNWKHIWPLKNLDTVCAMKVSNFKKNGPY